MPPKGNTIAVASGQDRRWTHVIIKGMARIVEMFRQLSGAVQSIPKVRGLWQGLVINSLYRMPSPDWPPVIRYGEAKWVIR